MEKDLYKKLYDNRLLENNEQICVFEETLEEVASAFCEDDIIELCQIFDDNSLDYEVMFGAIHLLETLSSEDAFANTIKGIVKMEGPGHKWAKTIIYRCLNDDFSIEMINKVLPVLDNGTRMVFYNLLDEIKDEDEQRFGDAINRISR